MGILSNVSFFVKQAKENLTPTNIIIAANLASSVYLTYLYTNDEDRNPDHFDRFTVNVLISLLQAGITQQNTYMRGLTGIGNIMSLGSLVMLNKNSPFLHTSSEQAALFLLRCMNLMQAGYMMHEEEQTLPTTNAPKKNN